MNQRDLLAQAMGLSELARAAQSGAARPVELGNIDLYHRPQHQNPDGSTSTVRTMGYNVGGLETNLPTIAPNGDLLHGRQALELFGRTGQHLGRYRTPEEAEIAAQALHLDQARMYGMR